MYDEDFRDETRFMKKIFIWIVGAMFVISIVYWFGFRTTRVIDAGIVNYEQFQEIYNTCSKLNTDLGIIRGVDEHDRMFDSFSKAAMITAKQQQLTRWVEEYNAKSKMWTRAMWKSSTLPYQLDVNQYPNYYSKPSGGTP